MLKIASEEGIIFKPEDESVDVINTVYAGVKVRIGINVKRCPANSAHIMSYRDGYNCPICEREIRG